MKASFICIICLLFVVHFSNAQKPDNSKPRYGDVKKSQKYIDIDNKMIETTVKQFGSREAAVKMTLDLGWGDFNKGDMNSAMRLFNQAWLLDSTLIDVNWGFGRVLAAGNQFDEAIYYLEKYYYSNLQNDKILLDLATCNFQYATSIKVKGQNDDWVIYIRKGKSYLLKSVLINDKNAWAYSKLAVAYYAENNNDSARHYGIIANKLDSTTTS